MLEAIIQYIAIIIKEDGRLTYCYSRIYNAWMMSSFWGTGSTKSNIVCTYVRSSSTTSYSTFWYEPTSTTGLDLNKSNLNCVAGVKKMALGYIGTKNRQVRLLEWPITLEISSSTTKRSETKKRYNNFLLRDSLSSRWCSR